MRKGKAQGRVQGEIPREARDDSAAAGTMPKPERDRLEMQWRVTSDKRQATVEAGKAGAPTAKPHSDTPPQIGYR
jgi:hypothetical protein